ncbi:non-ribosomal peptide synthetase, partial [uncultured Shewanella sp.]|uniref:non-ribosomal peptide synthetase n=1 Tax=uncultured Shewanella sp. TaxID=173975 RepID=UPI00261E2DCF
MSVYKTSISDFFSLHPAQENIWYDQKINSESPKYNIGQYQVINGEIDLLRLIQAWRKVIAVNDALRLDIQQQAVGIPLQRVLPPELVTSEIIMLDFSEQPTDEAAQTWMKKQYEQVFDVHRGERYQLALLKINAGRYYLYSRFHHLFVDGMSVFQIYEHIFSAYYTAISEGAHQTEKRPEYQQVAEKASDYILSKRYQRDKEYWHQFLSQHEMSRLTQFYPQQSQSDTFEVSLSQELTAGLREFCQIHQISLMVFLLSIVNLYFTRVLKTDELVISTSVHGRRGKIGMQTIGMHSNQIMIATTVDEKSHFMDLIKLSDHQLRQGMRHSQFPYGHQSRITADFKVDINVNYEYYPQSDFGMKSEYLSNSSDSIPLDIRLSDFKGEDALRLRVTYQHAFFNDTDIESLCSLFMGLMDQCMTQPETPLLNIGLLSVAERHKLLYTWNQTDVDYPQDKTLSQLFETQVSNTPEHIALVFNNESLTYRELNDKANQLAYVLREQYEAQYGHPLRPDTLIALYFDRSFEMVVSILAVLKAGGAYVPMSPEYPKARTLFMLADTQAPIVLSQQCHSVLLSHWLKELSPSPVVIIADSTGLMDKKPSGNLCSNSGPEDLAYVIYTSGTTGQPKGVMVSHASIVNRLNWMQQSYPLTNSDVLLQKTPYVFDVSVWELLWAIQQGATLVIAEPGIHKVPERLYQTVIANHVTKIHFVPSLLDGFILYLKALTLNIPSCLTHIFCSGEMLRSQTMREFESVNGSNIQLHNLYGPTEAAIDVTSFNCLEVNSEFISLIGKAINNTLLYVLTPQLQPTPIGVPGELYIGGAGLARGYLNREELTAERFIDNPFATAADIEKGYTRLYRTGDLVRWGMDGNLEYLGRLDSQVKIRGYRIELSEIENVLCQIEEVKQAVVIVKESDKDNDSGQFLAAFYVPTKDNKNGNAVLDSDTLCATLSQSLPDYMVPVSFTPIERIPLTLNGKLDRSALPEPEEMSNETYVAPRNDLENQLYQVWQQVLGSKRIGIHDNFFRIGGDSISAIRLSAKARELANIDIPLAELFKYPTIAKLAQHLDYGILIIPKAEQLDKIRLSFAQERLWFIEQFEAGSYTYHIPYLVRLRIKTDHSLLLKAINLVVARHSVLNSVYLETESGEAYSQELDCVLDYRVQKCVSQIEFEQCIRFDVQTPFKLSDQAPFRLRRYDVDGNRYLLFVWHHIAFDGWSSEVFFHELMECYQALDSDKKPNLAEQSINYGDYAIWQRETLRGEVLKVQLDYWREKLANFETLDLPIDKPRPSQIDYRGIDYNLTLDVAMSNELRALAQEHNTTLFTVMLSAFYLTLSQLSNQQDIIVGVPSDNRHLVQTQSLIGFFVNSLVLRTQVTPELTSSELINRVHECVQEAKVHQELPFEKLVSELCIERDLSRHPLFQVMFSLESFNMGGMQTEALFDEVSLLDESLFSPAKYDLSLCVDDGNEVLVIQWNYAQSLFETKSIVRFAGMYNKALSALLASEHKLAEVCLLSDDERYSLLHTRNSTEVAYPKDKTLQQLFEAQVLKTPDNIALVFEESELTYKILNERANQLAHSIRSQYQEKYQSELKPDTLIALYLDRSLEMFVSILAVLKAGGAYVPIAVEFPRARTLFVLQDTNAAFIITQTHYQTQLTEWLNAADLDCTVIPVMVDSANGDRTKHQNADINSLVYSNLASYSSDNPACINKHSDLAYVIYTSGTTGTPKGVMIEHSAIINRLHWMQSHQLLDQSDVVLQKTPYIFDVSLWELLGPSQVGACLVMAPPNSHTDPETLYSLISRYGITALDFSPSLLEGLSQSLAASGKVLPFSVRRVFCGGEALTATQVACFYQVSINSTKLYHMYGPTEAAIDSTYYECQPQNAVTSPPLGQVIDNIRLYVLNAVGQLTPIGVPGELYIGGAGLARGYLNREELT